MSASTTEIAAPGRFGARLHSTLHSAGTRVVVRRSLQAIPVLFGSSFVIFCLMNLLPGDAASAILGLSSTPQLRAELLKNLHLNEPFFERYARWLLGVLHGDFGTSLADATPVATVIRRALPVTFELVLLAFVLSLIVATPVALLAARKPRAIIDRLSIATSMFGVSTPNFVFALVLILIFSVHLAIVPVLGFVPISQNFFGNLHDMILPAVALAFALFCGYTRILRGDLIDEMRSQDYIMVALAEGVSPWHVLVRHVLRNSSFSLLTLVGLNFGTLIGGTVIIEQIFALPGIGQQLYQAIENRDYTVVQGIVLVMAVSVILANLITDLLYAVLDPRIRYGSRNS